MNIGVLTSDVPTDLSCSEFGEELHMLDRICLKKRCDSELELKHILFKEQF